jgi:hypothetical protein
VQKSGDFWHACSACAGDYEDPDRTAWVEMEAECEDEEAEPEEE